MLCRFSGDTLRALRYLFNSEISFFAILEVDTLIPKILILWHSSLVLIAVRMKYVFLSLHNKFTVDTAPMLWDSCIKTTTKNSLHIIHCCWYETDALSTFPLGIALLTNYSRASSPSAFTGRPAILSSPIYQFCSNMT